MVLAHVGPGGEAQLAALLAAWLLWFGGLRLGDMMQAHPLIYPIFYIYILYSGWRPAAGQLAAGTCPCKCHAVVKHHSLNVCTTCCCLA